MTKVYVGMSGGVDSSLTAALLVEKGYEVIGVYMKNWTQDLPGMRCPWADDLADAKRVAVQLGIDFKVFDFENEYREKVVEYMIDEYKQGRTPNPDIMCNQEVKFKLFLETALDDGADLIATGHYARVGNQTSALSERKHLQPESERALGTREDPERSRFRQNEPMSGAQLLQAVDTNKDQTYFLYRVTEKALEKTLFPLGEFTKPTVREMAKERGLYTAAKKDSQGICFVGQIGIREFLSQYVEQQAGSIIDKQTGKVLGQHDGAIFYTIGQRHGLDVGGGLPYYVVGKDMQKNEVHVTTNLNDDALWKPEITLVNVHWINERPKEGTYQIRVRHRASLISAKLSYVNDGEVKLVLDSPERAIAPGQSVVIYSNAICVGGGIII
ncbi:MAG: tRNA 2-thiouridine(34) synthase MnmA [Candidatus Saccharimonadaceae bacterium]